MGMTFKQKAGVFFDAAGFVLVTLLLYLCMASTLPLSREGENVLVTVSNYYLPLRRDIPMIVFFSVWPVLFVGVWIRRWSPGLPVREVRNYLAATLLLQWAGPLRDLLPGNLDWTKLARWPRVLWVLVIAVAALFLFFRILAVADEGDPRPDAGEFGKAVGFWFFGWTLFYSTFAALATRVLFDWGSVNRPFILAGIVMAYGSFRMGLKARRLAGQTTDGWLAWGTIVTGLWVLGVAVGWALMKFLT